MPHRIRPTAEPSADGSVPPAALPAAPRIALARHGTEIASRRDFLHVDRVDLVATYPDGTVSEPFPYDAVRRRSIDAVVLVAHRAIDGARHVYLRTAVRVPLTLRDETHDEAWVWELPAGMIDPGESPEEAAARELEEELGFRVEKERLVPLGPWTFPAPALIAERMHFFAVDVGDLPHGVPTEDGSPLERGAIVEARPIEALLAACRRGAFRDAKTELGLRRFAELP